MTFFANSGVAWPRTDDLSRKAATTALSGAEAVWRLIRLLEDRSDSTVVPAIGTDVDDSKKDAVAALRDAAKKYGQVGNLLTGELYEPLTPADLQVAALETTDLYLLYGLDVIAIDPRQSGSLPITLLYKQLQVLP